MTDLGHARPNSDWRRATGLDLDTLRAELEEQRRFRVEQLELVDIDAALQRIRRNRYGLCPQCGTPIPMEQLRALPMVRRCMPCQYAKETNNLAADASRPPRRAPRVPQPVIAPN